MRKIIATLLLAVPLALTAACGQSDADVVSHNISKDADNFKVQRRIVAINGFTDKYILSVEGRCNITDQGNQLEIVCKVQDGYKKHFVGLSDNTTYFVEQVDAANVSKDHYKVVFKPETIVPDVEVR